MSSTPDTAPLVMDIQPEIVEMVGEEVLVSPGSDLEMLLRARGIRTLVLTGIATSGVVLSTLRRSPARSGPGVDRWPAGRRAQTR